MHKGSNYSTGAPHCADDIILIRSQAAGIEAGIEKAARRKMAILDAMRRKGETKAADGIREELALLVDVDRYIKDVTKTCLRLEGYVRYLEAESAQRVKTIWDERREKHQLQKSIINQTARP